MKSKKEQEQPPKGDNLNIYSYPALEDEMETIRSRLTDLSIYISLIAGLPIIIFNAIQTIKFGFDFTVWAIMTVYSMIGIFAFMRNSIHYRIRATVSICLFYLTIFFGLSHFGLTLAAIIGILVTTILSITILGKHNGLLLSLLTGGFGLIVALIFDREDLFTTFQTVDPFQLIHDWWPQLLALLAFYFSLAISISLYESSLKRSIHELQFQKKELQVLNNDLTHSKNKAEKANQAKSQFMSIMSHELKTPLNPVFGFLNLLKDEDLNEESQEFLIEIEKGARQLYDIISEILIYIELDRENKSIDALSMHLKELCQKMVEPFEEQAKSKGLKFTTTYELDADDPTNGKDLLILSDPIWLSKVLENLLSNAIKFTQAGEIGFKARTVQTSAKQIIEFIISDDGPGISAAMIDSVFEPFFQAEDANSRKHEGIGLGLSVANKAAKLLNGSITIESGAKSKKGSIFVLRIPYISGRENVKATHPSESSRNPIQETKHNI